MRKKTELVMVAVLILAAVFAGPKSAAYVMSMKAETAVPVIVLDAGHGGSQLRGIRRKAAAVPERKRLPQWDNFRA
ncbi:MAG: hypothetical protein LIO96_09525 [Lachnospiraceae bacterium]|nr:hypothetical protein [Lachnospiraceae bacterium]